jgi:hypothetical protein
MPCHLQTVKKKWPSWNLSSTFWTDSVFRLKSSKSAQSGTPSHTPAHIIDVLLPSFFLVHRLDYSSSPNVRGPLRQVATCKWKTREPTIPCAPPPPSPSAFNFFFGRSFVLLLIFETQRLHPTTSIALLLPTSSRGYGYVCRLLAPSSFFPPRLFFFILFVLLASPVHTAAALCIDMYAGFKRENWIVEGQQVETGRDVFRDSGVSFVWRALGAQFHR